MIMHLLRSGAAAVDGDLRPGLGLGSASRGISEAHSLFLSRWNQQDAAAVSSCQPVLKRGLIVVRDEHELSIGDGA